MKLKFFIVPLVFLLLVGGFQTVKAQEMVLIDKTISWDMSSPNGFYFFQPPAGSPSNWVTPFNYYTGKFYIRYEIISQSTSEPCGLQFGIWQYRPNRSASDKVYTEIMSDIRPMSGSGTTDIHNSSPNSWWSNSKVYNGVTYSGVDFTKVNDFWQLGINIWSLNPKSVIANDNWGGTNALWNTRNKWFPIQVHVTVIAVAQGYTFSGWDNTTKPEPPFYSIAFDTEKTKQPVSNKDEYSYSSNMSNLVTGNGLILDLLPGKDVFFRTKAADGKPASSVFTLNVPARPTPPDIGIDFENEKTKIAIPTNYTYSNTSDFTISSSGNGTQISIIPGNDLYYKLKSTSSAFASTVRKLDVPARPSSPTFTINFEEKSTTQNIPPAIEHSQQSGFENAISGDNTPLELTPGKNIYFRVKSTNSSFKSVGWLLQVPIAPAPPVFTINFLNEQTKEVAESYVQYDYTPTLVNPKNGSGIPINLQPGKTLYYRKKGNSTTFPSQIGLLILPTRPKFNIVFTINYKNSRTNIPVPIQVEYADNLLFTNSIKGNNTFLTIIPSKNVYFRNLATNNAFASESLFLEVPGQENAPSFEINFITEKTKTAIASDYEYSNNASFSPVTSGNNALIVLKPGTTVYFRKKSSLTSFASKSQVMEVPNRPQAPSFSIDFTNEKTFELVSATIEYSSNNTFSEAQTGTNIKNILIPGKDMYFRIKANNTLFASETFHLDVPERPAGPNPGINFINETTLLPVASNVQYSENITLENPLQGKGTVLKLIPSESLYFFTDASTNAFSSEVYNLVSPPRPEPPSISINFETEKTDIPISDKLEYASTLNFNKSSFGNNKALTLVPGTELFFRKKASVENFAGKILQLIIPQRPTFLSNQGNEIHTLPALFTLIPPNSETNINVSQIIAQNAELQSAGGLNMNVIKVTGNNFTILIPSSVLANGHFASVVQNYTYFPTSIINETGNKHILWPNPATDIVNISLPDIFIGDVTVFFYSLSGELVLVHKSIWNDLLQVPLQKLKQGYYIIKIQSNSHIIYEKLLIN